MAKKIQFGINRIIIYMYWQNYEQKIHWLANQKTEQNWIKVDPYVIVTLITRQ